jgi:hypothetical protein
MNCTSTSLVLQNEPLLQQACGRGVLPALERHNQRVRRARTILEMVALFVEPYTPKQLTEQKRLKISLEVSHLLVSTADL